MPRMISGAQKIVDALIAHKVEHVFIFPGGTIAPILDVIEKKTKIKIICPRNEQGAGYAALAYAKLTGKPAVFIVTSGPGVTNAVTPIADAYYDNVPLVVLTGQVGTGDMRGSIPVKQRGFQEVDTIDLMRPITKAALFAGETKDLPALMEKAFSLAGSGRMGPVVVDLPMNVQRTSIAPDEFVPVEKEISIKKQIPPEALAKAAALVRAASRPVIIAGGGVIASGATAELRAFADRYQIPVVMSMPGMGAYPSASPLSLGLFGYAGSQYANTAVQTADLLLCVGTTLHVRQTGSLPEKIAPDATVIRIDIDTNELEHSRVRSDVSIHADAKDALKALTKSVGRMAPKTGAWRKEIARLRKEYALPVVSHKGKLKAQTVIELADAATDSRETIVTTGVGQHQVWVPRHFNFDYPRRTLLTSSGHGTMGFDLPAAIGAKIARPKARVICFVGDGSLQMNIQELATIVELKLDIKIVVLDNHALNIVAQFQRQNWKSHPSTGDRYNPDFAEIARAYGIPSVSIKTPTEAKKKLKAALGRSGPVLIHCDIDPKEDLLPMLLGGHTLDDMSLDYSFDA